MIAAFINYDILLCIYVWSVAVETTNCAERPSVAFHVYKQTCGWIKPTVFSSERTLGRVERLRQRLDHVTLKLSMETNANDRVTV